MLELDHVLCFVEPAGDWVERLERAGWTLDAGSTHPGQGSRNRRLPWGSGYLEDAACAERGAMLAGNAATVRTLQRVLHAAPLPTPSAWAELPLPLRSVTAPAPHLTLAFGDGGPVTEVTEQLRLQT